MDDPLVRLMVVGAAAALVAGWSWWRRRLRAGDAWRFISETGLRSGTYLFTSAACGDCNAAREKLGRAAYTEYTWEEAAELFKRLGIAEVPSTLFVVDDGSGSWHRGVPGERLSKHNP